MYTAIFTLLIAFSLLSANWLIVLPCIVGIIVVYARINKEERMMIEQFGGEYRDYMKHTGRLLPRLTR
jgi:protein-S-isoprenylcysteine O-methyltransferase Ste14